MTSILALFIQGVSLGFTATVSPGPFLAYVIAETLAFGWRHSFVIALSPLLSDLPAALLSLFVLGQMPPWALKAIQVIGGLLVLYLAWGTLCRLRQRAGVTVVSDSAPQTQHVFLRGALMNLLSPGLWIFWTTVNGPIVLTAWRESPASAIAYVVGFYGLWIGGLFGWVAVFHQARRFDERVVRGLLTASVAIMAVFGVLLIKTALFG